MSAVTDSTLDQVLQAHQRVLLLMWQQECPPCKQMVPILQNVARKHPDIHFFPVNIHVNPRTQARFGVTASPTMLLFSRGRNVARWLGPIPEEKVSAWITRSLEVETV